MRVYDEAAFRRDQQRGAGRLALACLVAAAVLGLVTAIFWPDEVGIGAAFFGVMALLVGLGPAHEYWAQRKKSRAEWERETQARLDRLERERHTSRS